MKRIEKIIKKMMLENTGRALCDSGDAYGRNYERNANVDFSKLEDVVYTINKYKDGYELEYTVNLYNYLVKVLEVNDETDYLNKKLKKWLKSSDEWGYDDFIQNVISADKCYDMVNIYNGEYNVSQIFQFQQIEFNGGYFVILEIHGGYDVRGGYTDPYIFELPNEYLTGLPSVYGTIDGIQVDNCYNGYSLTDEDGKEIEIKENSIIELYLGE